MSSRESHSSMPSSRSISATAANIFNISFPAGEAKDALQNNLNI